MMMKAQTRRKVAPESSHTPAKRQFEPRSFASPEPKHESLGREAQFGHSFGEINLFPIQPKLVVGPADDKYEREADRVAEQVMRMPESGVPETLRQAVDRKSRGRERSVPVVNRTPEQGLLQRYIPAGQLQEFGTAEQTVFMRRVYELQRQMSAGQRTFVGDLPANQLAEVEGGVQARRDAAAACRMLLHAAREALQEDQRRGDRLASQVRSIGVASGYRSARRRVT